jgi:hypothetical protein
MQDHLRIQYGLSVGASINRHFNSGHYATNLRCTGKIIVVMAPDHQIVTGNQSFAISCLEINSCERRSNDARSNFR